MTRETLEKGNELLKSIEYASSLKSGLEFIMAHPDERHSVEIYGGNQICVSQFRITEAMCQDLLAIVNNHIDCLKDEFKALKDIESEEVF